MAVVYSTRKENEIETTEKFNQLKMWEMMRIQKPTKNRRKRKSQGTQP